jgi:hypothetical protein
MAFARFEFSSMAFARAEYSFCLKSLDYLLSKKAFQFVLNRREHDLAEAHLFYIGLRTIWGVLWHEAMDF